MMIWFYSKTCVKRPLSKRPKIGFQDRLSLYAGKKYCRMLHFEGIAECSTWSILQYFRPSLSYRFLLRSLFCLFLSGRFTQVLLYLISRQWTKKAERNQPLIHNHKTLKLNNKSQWINDDSLNNESVMNS